MGDVFVRLLATVANEKQPILTRGVLWQGEIDEVAQEALFLPLSSDGIDVDYVISVGSYENRLSTRQADGPP